MLTSMKLQFPEIPPVHKRLTRHIDDICAELEEVPADEMLRRAKNGTRVTKTDKCTEHGPFERVGYSFDDWTAWLGCESFYTSGWSVDGGCAGCKQDRQEIRTEWEAKHPGRSYPEMYIHQFELVTPAYCDEHGEFEFKADLHEHTEKRAAVFGTKAQVNFDICPRCGADMQYEMEIQDRLNLSREEWERGGKRIMAAIDYAQQQVTQ